jgi:glycosyltransferase involved in cell wall biosynthesis
VKKKNITIFTPFYPINHRKDLFEDTKVVHQLIKSFSDKFDVTIVHTYMHSFRNSWKKIRSVMIAPIENEVYIFKDSYNNKVWFFEYLFLIPKSFKLLSFFHNKYLIKLISEIKKNHLLNNTAIFHLPTYYSDVITNPQYEFEKKVAIIHAFDIKNIKNRKDIKYWNRVFNEFDLIGFRSYQIEKEFMKYITYSKESFLCLSGIPSKFIESPIKYNTYEKKDTIHIIFAGVLNKNKNVKQVIDILSYFSGNYDFVFTIIGEGPEKKSLERYVERKGMSKNIKFLGKLSRDDTFEHMMNSDIFIMLSKKETFGLVYLEAMAAGCIVLGTKDQGIDGIIIDGENGYLMDINENNKITEEFAKILSLCPETQTNIKRNAKETVKFFSEDKISKEYFEEINSLIEGSK